MNPSSLDGGVATITKSIIILLHIIIILGYANFLFSPFLSLLQKREVVSDRTARLNDVLAAMINIHQELRPSLRRVATQTDTNWSTEDCGDSNNNRVAHQQLKLDAQIDSERTAVAALTELSNLTAAKNGAKDATSSRSASSAAAASSSSHQSASMKKVVTTMLNSLNSLNRSDSISVIPLMPQQQQLYSHTHNQNTKSVGGSGGGHESVIHNINHNNKQINILNNRNYNTKNINKIKVKDMSQLETAAVLMDISKKAVISPPNSNPQSPPPSSSAALNSIHQQLLRRNSASSMSTLRKRSLDDCHYLDNKALMDLSIKRIKAEHREGGDSRSDEQQQQAQRPVDEGMAAAMLCRDTVIKKERGAVAMAANKLDNDNGDHVEEDDQHNHHHRHQHDMEMNNRAALLNTLKNRHHLNVIKLNNDNDSRGPVMDRVSDEEGSGQVSDDDDDDEDSSDPDRLQVDISTSQENIEFNHDAEDEEPEVSISNLAQQEQQYQHYLRQQHKNVENHSRNRGGGGGGKGSRGRKSRQNHPKASEEELMALAMSGGNVVVGGMDKAPNYTSAMFNMANALPGEMQNLWHLLAQTTSNNNNGLPGGGGSGGHASKEATQLLHQMNNSMNLSQLSNLSDFERPLSLLKVSVCLII